MLHSPKPLGKIYVEYSARTTLAYAVSLLALPLELQKWHVGRGGEQH
jgi:hypothetical protein